MGENGSMVTLEDLRRGKKAAIDQLALKHGALSIRVFGSVAPGDNSGASDVDFLVEFANDRTLFDLIALRLDLRELLGVEVDVVTPNSLHYVRDRVLAEAQAI
jgi:uncharacterized protein